MKRAILILSAVIILSISFSLSVYVYSQHEGREMQGQAKEKADVRKPASKKAVYYCPMHPGYTSDMPGDCPICNMKLVKKQEAGAVEKDVKEPGDISKSGDTGFYISPEKQQLIGVKTDKVIYRPLSKIIRTVGRVAFDPELYKAQQEYIEAINTKESVKESGQEEVIKRAEALVEAAKLKLKLQGLDIKQIDELQKTGKNDQSLLISSPESDSTLVYATVYEYELEWVKIGQEAVISAASYPGREFRGEIAAIDPVFDPITRSVRARIKTENKESLLKPDMYVDVEMRSDLGAHLALPKEAVMDSGLRKI